jgi:mannose-6-phosphate isomerase-like protein (cupin superfamily)
MQHKDERDIVVTTPTLIPVPGGKTIEEYFGRVNTEDESVSVARMVAPAGWDEPAQRPAFDEYTLVLEGALIVESDVGEFEVRAGHAILTPAGTRVRYRTEDGATYVAVCLPAFAEDLAAREE